VIVAIAIAVRPVLIRLAGRLSKLREAAINRVAAAANAMPNDSAVIGHDNKK